MSTRSIEICNTRVLATIARLWDCAFLIHGLKKYSGTHSYLGLLGSTLTIILNPDTDSTIHTKDAQRKQTKSHLISRSFHMRFLQRNLVSSEMPTGSDEPVESSTDSDGQLEGETEGFQIGRFGISLRTPSFYTSSTNTSLPVLTICCETTKVCRWTYSSV